MSEHYVEVHVNVDPESLENVDLDGFMCGFRRGKLLMDKGGRAPDAFFTWRGYSTSDAEAATCTFVSLLQSRDVKVLRYKMEMTLVDLRESDRWSLL